MLYNVLDAAVRPEFAAPYQRGAARSGRDLTTLERAAAITAAIDQDAATARRWARHHIAFYSVIPYFDVMFELHGFQREASAIRDAAANGDPGGRSRSSVKR